MCVKFSPWWGYEYFLELHNTYNFLRSKKYVKKSEQGLGKVTHIFLLIFISL